MKETLVLFITAEPAVNRRLIRLIQEVPSAQNIVHVHQDIGRIIMTWCSAVAKTIDPRSN